MVKMPICRTSSDSLDSSSDSRTFPKASRWFNSSGWLSLLLVSAFPIAGYAGAWVKEPFKYSIYQSFGFYEADQLYDYQGNKRPVRIIPDLTSTLPTPVRSTYRQYDLTLYIEYGLPADFEFDLSFPYYVIAQQRAPVGTYSASGISDLVSIIKYKWFERDWLISSIQFDLGIPIGDESAQDTVSGLTTPQSLALGDGEWDYGLRLIGSRSFTQIPVYVSAEIGYRFRNFERGGDDLPWSVEGGYTFNFERKWFSGLTLYTAFAGIVALDDLSAQDALVLGSSTIASGRSPNQESVEARPGFFLKVYGPLSVGVNSSHVLMGKNTGAGWGIRTAVAWESQ
jgi:hypothetical protein